MRSASLASCPGRWCARRTVPERCTSRRWRAAPPPRAPSHSSRRLSPMSNAAPEPAKGRIRQIRQAYTITKKSDRNIGLILLLTFLVAGGAFAALGLLTFGSSVFGLVLSIVFAVLVGILVVLIVFGRRAEKAAYSQVEGQVGAAAGALQMMRK